MEWLGLSGTAFLASLLALGGAVVALYLLKEQRRRVTVPALALWESLLKSRAQAALSTRLRRILSLLLALTVLLILLLALADLRQRIAVSGRSIVVLVDRSASMGATDEPNHRLAAAKRQAAKLIAQLNATDRMLIATLDQHATPRCTWTSDVAILREALHGITQSDMTGDLVPGVRLALDALHGRSEPEIYLISDGNLTGETQAKQLLGEQTKTKTKFHYLRVGSSARNLGITSFAVRSYPLDQRHLEGVVSLKNFGKDPEVVVLSVDASGTPLYDETITLAPGESAFRTLEDLPFGNDPLRASLKLAKGPDVLPSDDRAYAILPAQKRLRVLVVSDGNRYLEAALLLDEYLEVVEQTPPQYEGAQGFDVVIFDRVKPAQAPTVPALYLGTQEGPGYFPLAISDLVARPFFDRVDSQHRTMRSLSLRDVNLARAFRTKPDAGDHVIAETSARIPLIVEGRRNARFLALTFDVRESDLPLRPAWPLFVLRSLEHLAERGETESSSQRTGTLIRVELPSDVRSTSAQVTLQSPAGTRESLPVAQHEARFLAEQSGLYRVERGELQGIFAINVDTTHEGYVAPHPALFDTPASTAATKTATRLWPERTWPWFVVLALILLALEWLSFHRRWTV